MKHYITLFFVLIMFVWLVGCGSNSSTPQPESKESMTVTYAYETSIKGTNLTFFTEKSYSQISMAFPGNNSPSFEDITKMTSNAPVTDLKIIISKGLDTFFGKTNSQGHLNLNVPITDGNMVIEGWQCAAPNVSWQSSSDGIIFPSGGAIFVCQR